MNSSQRMALQDPDYKAEDFLVDTELRFGPIKSRGCTDVLCWIIFFASFIGYGVSI